MGGCVGERGGGRARERDREREATKHKTGEEMRNTRSASAPCSLITTFVQISLFQTLLLLLKPIEEFIFNGVCGRALPAQTKVDSGASQSKSGTSVNLSDCEKRGFANG